MLKSLRKRNQGFTIIEVLIVLAIAGLIMVIVFLAVPALQRSSRNTQRTSDASKVAAAVSECMANRNNQSGSCDQSPAVGELPLDMTKLSQITSVVYWGNATWAEVDAGREALVLPWYKCMADGSWVEYTGNWKQFIIFYKTENPGGPQNRCLDV